MRKLILLFLLFATAPVFAGEATFTWVKPDPAFDVAVPTDWIIDEYRIYCSVAGGGNYMIAVPGYDTEIYNAVQMPPGETNCYMTSWSIKANAESEQSITVTKTIYDSAPPNSPAGFDFAPAVE